MIFHRREIVGSQLEDASRTSSPKGKPGVLSSREGIVRYFVSVHVILWGEDECSWGY